MQQFFTGFLLGDFDSLPDAAFHIHEQQHLALLTSPNVRFEVIGSGA